MSQSTRESSCVTASHWKGLIWVDARSDLGYPPSLQVGGCGALASHTGQVSHLCCQAFSWQCCMTRTTRPMIGGSQGPETWHPEVQNTKRVWDGNVAEPPRPSSDSSFQAALVGVSASDLAAELQAVNMSPFQCPRVWANETKDHTKNRAWPCPTRSIASTQEAKGVAGRSF